MMKRAIAAVAAFLCTVIVAYGQSAQPVVPLQAGTPVGVGNPMYIQGTLTASLGGFTPSASGARMTPLSVTTSDSSGNLPTGGVVVVSNVGTTNPMYCNVNGVAATTSDQPITANGGWFPFTIPSGVTTLHCIATGGTTTANGVGGAGLATGTGGGGGGSGGGGAITAASGSYSSGALASGSIASGAIASGAVASGAYASGAIGSGAIASGAVASGAVASGAYAAGSLSAGAGVDGWDLTQGAKADAAWTTGGGSTISILKAIAGNTSGPVPAGTAIIGALVANQSVNTAQINGVTPLMGNGQTGTGAPRVTLSQDSASAAINVSTGTTTQLVALSGSTKIYVTSFDVIAGGTGNITFVYGTGSACGTGTTSLTGAYPLVAQAGISKGSGVGTVLLVPAGNALCVTTSASVQMSGSVSYLQF